MMMMMMIAQYSRLFDSSSTPMETSNIANQVPYGKVSQQSS
jgi:hypothetical protein